MFVDRAIITIKAGDGGNGDEIESAVDLDDAALDQKLRNGFDFPESNTNSFEEIMINEMESEYANQLRGK